MKISRWVVAALACVVPCPAQTPAAAPPPLGTLVDVGGYRVHLYCIGSGSPAAVITGSGYSFDWGLVLPEVAKFTRVCAYDHSGAAWSDPGPRDTCALRVSEIHMALRKAPVAGPYVLVGHSLGALVARLYAATHEDEVAGMVIVDHTTGRAVARFSAPPGAVARVPLAARADPNTGFEKLPPRDYRLHLWATSQPRFAEGMRRNVEMAGACAADVDGATRNRAAPLGGKPLVSLSSPATRGLHASLLSLSSNSKQVIAEGSGHYVMLDRPDLVIGAIREAVESVRTHARLKP